jgi:predicted GIY-YIG superfamily endonuclease
LLCPAPTSTFSAAIQARLYIGVTSNLYLRVTQHKEGTWEGFTATYGCKRLLYFEGYENIRTAIAREKQLKGWRRKEAQPHTLRSIPSSKTLHRPGDGR